MCFFTHYFLSFLFFIHSFVFFVLFCTLLFSSLCCFMHIFFCVLLYTIFVFVLFYTLFFVFLLFIQYFFFFRALLYTIVCLLCAFLYPIVCLLCVYNFRGRGFLAFQGLNGRLPICSPQTCTSADNFRFSFIFFLHISEEISACLALMPRLWFRISEQVNDRSNKGEGNKSRRQDDSDRGNCGAVGRNKNDAANRGRRMPQLFSRTTSEARTIPLMERVQFYAAGVSPKLRTLRTQLKNRIGLLARLILVDTVWSRGYFIWAPIIVLFKPRCNNNDYYRNDARITREVIATVFLQVNFRTALL